MFPLPSRLVLFIVFMLVQLTRVGCTVTAHVLPFTEVTHVLEIVLLLIPIPVPALYRVEVEVVISLIAVAPTSV